MKRWLSSALILLLVLMMAMPALAEDEAQYATTKDFIRVLEEKELAYTYNGIDEDDDEMLNISFTPDPYEECKFRFAFTEDAVNIHMYYLVTVSAGENYTLKTINDLNCSYKYVTFVYDESDSTITLKMALPLYGTESGENVFEMMSNAIQILTNDEVETALLSLK